jgi:ribosomal protein L35AE/L33A
MWSSGDYFTGAIDTAALGQAAADAQPKPRVSYSKRSGGPYKVKKGWVLRSHGGHAPVCSSLPRRPGARSALGTSNPSLRI